MTGSLLLIWLFAFQLNPYKEGVWARFTRKVDAISQLFLTGTSLITDIIFAGGFAHRLQCSSVLMVVFSQNSGGSCYHDDSTYFGCLFWPLVLSSVR